MRDLLLHYWLLLLDMHLLDMHLLDIPLLIATTLTTTLTYTWHASTRLRLITTIPFICASVIKPDSFSAMELISHYPIQLSTKRVVSCDGGNNGMRQWMIMNIHIYNPSSQSMIMNIYIQSIISINEHVEYNKHITYDPFIPTHYLLHRWRCIGYVLFLSINLLINTKGHPKIFINLDREKDIACGNDTSLSSPFILFSVGYCGVRYQLDHSHFHSH